MIASTLTAHERALYLLPGLRADAQPEPVMSFTTIPSPGSEFEQILDILGRLWNPILHPRDRNGRFIRTFSRVTYRPKKRVDTAPTFRGDVLGFDQATGDARIRVTQVDDKYREYGLKVGDIVQVPQKDLETRLIKGRLDSRKMTSGPSDQVQTVIKNLRRLKYTDEANRIQAAYRLAMTNKKGSNDTAISEFRDVADLIDREKAKLVGVTDDEKAHLINIKSIKDSSTRAQLQELDNIVRSLATARHDLGDKVLPFEMDRGQASGNESERRLGVAKAQLDEQYAEHREYIDFRTGTKKPVEAVIPTKPADQVYQREGENVLPELLPSLAQKVRQGITRAAAIRRTAMVAPGDRYHLDKHGDAVFAGSVVDVAAGKEGGSLRPAARMIARRIHTEKSGKKLVYVRHFDPSYAEGYKDYRVTSKNMELASIDDQSEALQNLAINGEISKDLLTSFSPQFIMAMRARYATKDAKGASRLGGNFFDTLPIDERVRKDKYDSEVRTGDWVSMPNGELGIVSWISGKENTIRVQTPDGQPISRLSSKNVVKMHPTDAPGSDYVPTRKEAAEAARKMGANDLAKVIEDPNSDHAAIKDAMAADSAFQQALQATPDLYASRDRALAAGRDTDAETKAQIAEFNKLAAASAGQFREPSAPKAQITPPTPPADTDVTTPPTRSINQDETIDADGTRTNTATNETIPGGTTPPTTEGDIPDPSEFASERGVSARFYNDLHTKAHALPEGPTREVALNHLREFGAAMRARDTGAFRKALDNMLSPDTGLYTPEHIPTLRGSELGTHLGKKLPTKSEPDGEKVGWAEYFEDLEANHSKLFFSPISDTTTRPPTEADEDIPISVDITDDEISKALLEGTGAVFFNSANEQVDEGYAVQQKDTAVSFPSTPTVDDIKGYLADHPFNDDDYLAVHIDPNDGGYRISRFSVFPNTEEGRASANALAESSDVNQFIDISTGEVLNVSGPDITQGDEPSPTDKSAERAVTPGATPGTATVQKRTAKQTQVLQDLLNSDPDETTKAAIQAALDGTPLTAEQASAINNHVASISDDVLGGDTAQQRSGNKGVAAALADRIARATGSQEPRGYTSRNTALRRSSDIASGVNRAMSPELDEEISDTLQNAREALKGGDYDNASTLFREVADALEAKFADQPQTARAAARAREHADRLDRTEAGKGEQQATLPEPTAPEETTPEETTAPELGAGESPIPDNLTYRPWEDEPGDYVLTENDLTPKGWKNVTNKTPVYHKPSDPYDSYMIDANGNVIQLRSHPSSPGTPRILEWRAINNQGEQIGVAYRTELDARNAIRRDGSKTPSGEVAPEIGEVGKGEGVPEAEAPTATPTPAQGGLEGIAEIGNFYDKNRDIPTAESMSGAEVARGINGWVTSGRGQDYFNNWLINDASATDVRDLFDRVLSDPDFDGSIGDVWNVLAKYHTEGTLPGAPEGGGGGTPPPTTPGGGEGGGGATAEQAMALQRFHDSSQKLSDDAARDFVLKAAIAPDDSLRIATGTIPPLNVDEFISAAGHAATVLDVLNRTRTLEGSTRLSHSNGPLEGWQRGELAAAAQNILANLQKASHEDSEKLPTSITGPIMAALKERLDEYGIGDIADISAPDKAKALAAREKIRSTPMRELTTDKKLADMIRSVVDVIDAEIKNPGITGDGHMSTRQMQAQYGDVLDRLVKKSLFMNSGRLAPEVSDALTESGALNRGLIARSTAGKGTWTFDLHDYIAMQQSGRPESLTDLPGAVVRTVSWSDTSDTFNTDLVTDDRPDLDAYEGANPAISLRINQVRQLARQEADEAFDKGIGMITPNARRLLNNTFRDIGGGFGRSLTNITEGDSPLARWEREQMAEGRTGAKAEGSDKRTAEQMSAAFLKGLNALVISDKSLRDTARPEYNGGYGHVVTHELGHAIDSMLGEMLGPSSAYFSETDPEFTNLYGKILHATTLVPGSDPQANASDSLLRWYYRDAAWGGEHHNGDSGTVEAFAQGYSSYAAARSQAAQWDLDMSAEPKNGTLRERREKLLRRMGSSILERRSSAVSDERWDQARLEVGEHLFDYFDNLEKNVFPGMWAEGPRDVIHTRIVSDITAAPPAVNVVVPPNIQKQLTSVKQHTGSTIAFEKAPERGTPEWDALVADMKNAHPTIATPGGMFTHIVFNPDARTNPEASVVWRMWAPGKSQTQTAYSEHHGDSGLAQKHQRGTLVDEQMPTIVEASKIGAKEGNPVAAMTLMIALTGMRVSSSDNAGTIDRKTGKKIPTYGASSLQKRHIFFPSKTMVRFKFLGKSGKENIYESRDPDLIDAMHKLVEGKTGTQQIFPTTNSSQSIAFLRQVSGIDDMKNHDLRTWMATNIAREAIANTPKSHIPKDKDSFEKERKRVAKIVGDAINDGPAVADKNYIAPSVWWVWQEAAGLPTDMDDPFITTDGPGVTEDGKTAEDIMLTGSAAAPTPEDVIPDESAPRYHLPEDAFSPEAIAERAEWYASFTWPGEPKIGPPGGDEDEL